MIEAILKRKKIRLPSPSYQQGNAFFITIATYEKYPWFRLYPQLADAAQVMLCTIAEERGAKLYAWLYYAGSYSHPAGRQQYCGVCKAF